MESDLEDAKREVLAIESRIRGALFGPVSRETNQLSDQLKDAKKTTAYLHQKLLDHRRTCPKCSGVIAA
jgi:hypothetical protein